MKRILILSSLLLMSVLQGVCQDDLLAKMDISLLTCESGDELYTTFGHTAIRLKNDSIGIDRVYNYGVFDFNTSYFYVKFLRGKLPYRLAVANTQRFLANYDAEERSMYEQKLNLTPTQRIALVRLLMENSKKENREYKYDFFFDNCTTRAIDAIDSVTGTIEYASDPVDITFRQMLKENLQGMPWSEFGIDLIIGAVADQKTTRKDQHFLPLYLYRDMSRTTVVNDKMRQNLVLAEQQLLDHEQRRQERSRKVTNWPLVFIGILVLLEFLLVVTGPRRAVQLYDKIWFWLLFLMGVVMAIMWWGTDHLATKDNWNLLWASPLLGPFLWLRSRRVRVVLASLVGVGCLLTMVNSLFTFLPQYFLPAFGLLALITVIKLVRWYRHSTV